MIDLRNCYQITSIYILSIPVYSKSQIELIDECAKQYLATKQKSPNRRKDIKKKNIRAKSRAVVFHRVGAKIGAGNAEARRMGTRHHNFTPFYLCRPFMNSESSSSGTARPVCGYAKAESSAIGITLGRRTAIKRRYRNCTFRNCSS